MIDPIARVLHLVADGKLTAEEAAPILDALSAREPATDAGDRDSSANPLTAGSSGNGGSPGSGGSGSAKYARIQVMEGGRRVVDLRIPTSLGKFALGRVPGLSGEQVNDLERAISAGQTGPFLDIQDEDGSGVRIVLE